MGERQANSCKCTCLATKPSQPPAVPLRDGFPNQASGQQSLWGRPTRASGQQFIPLEAWRKLPAASIAHLVAAGGEGQVDAAGAQRLALKLPGGEGALGLGCSRKGPGAGWQGALRLAVGWKAVGNYTVMCGTV